MNGYRIIESIVCIKMHCHRVIELHIQFLALRGAECKNGQVLRFSKRLAMWACWLFILRVVAQT